MNKKNGRYYRLLIPFFILCVIMALLFAKDLGVQYKLSDPVPAFISSAEYTIREYDENIKCLVIKDDSQESSIQAEKQLVPILNSMRVAYTMEDINKDFVGTLDEYENIVIAGSNLESFNNIIMDIFNWVKAGGRLMFAQTIDITTLFQGIKSKLGIFEGGESYSVVDTFTFETDFMIGGKGKIFHIDDGYESSLVVSLDDKSTIHMVSGGEKKLPLLWETTYGQGKIVVNNHGLCIKATRGILAAAYSLLDDVCVYPVINSSSFFLDDFPSPVPDDYE